MFKVSTVKGPSVKPPTALTAPSLPTAQNTLLAVAITHSKGGTRPPFDFLIRRAIATPRVLDHILK